MTFSLSLLASVAFGYMLLLFLIAYAADQAWISKRLAMHPLTFTLSLGVYATSWSYYGSVGFAETQGYNFLTIYLGVTLAFLLAPILLMPLLRLTRDYQLTSLADLFTFRYRSQMVGILVTLFMLVGVLPYLALQIRAVTESIYILTKEASPDLLALGFCVFLIIFSILFGARHVRPRERHQGLVVAIAFETAVKLLALIVVGVTALAGVWGGFGELSNWLQANPQALEALYQPTQEGPWSALLLLAFAAAFLLPRQFHMIFAENNDPHALSVASWGFPVILLLMNLPVPLVLWAGQALSLEIPADYYVLGVTLAVAGQSPLPVLAFIGGVSAASAMMIVTTIALASMCLNHFLLPVSYPPDPSVNLYRWLLWGRRILIALIVMAGYGFYRLLEHSEGLVQLGLISFVAVTQFLPGICGVLFWRRATRNGFIAGLIGGIAVWCVTLLAPLLASSGILLSQVQTFQPPAGEDKWIHATFWSLAVNSVLFVVFSLLFRQRESEHRAAQACCSDSLVPPRGKVMASTVTQFKNQLARVVGEDAAIKEVNRALDDLGMQQTEKRYTELRRLREQIERNLSGLLGPQLAHIIVNQRLELMEGSQTILSGTISHVEQRLEESRTRLRGLAAEVDLLHRYHRQILLDLPLGVCTLSAQHEVLIWNRAMEEVSSLKALNILGNHIKDVPSPWGPLLNQFALTTDHSLQRTQIHGEERPRWLNLHKAVIIEPSDPSAERPEPSAGFVMLVEDLTELETLEAELVHSERLASVGRLAAGVAHEIGNPVTGIASLAQNLRDETDSEEVQLSSQQILEQTRRITAIVQSLMSYSHGGDEARDREPVDLCSIIDEAVQLVTLSHRGKHMDYHLSCPESLIVVGERQRLLQVVVNLLTNAHDASELGASVQVDVTSGEDGVTLVVKDQGKGMTKQSLEHIFEPFFTTKRPGEGTGLGLSLVYKIVQDHGGRIWVESEVDKGTKVTVCLPHSELETTVLG